MISKQGGRRIYKTANGKNIDLDLLIARNELTPAVGNVRVNARGDELGPGGKIVRKKEDILRDYYDQSSTIKNEVLVDQPTPSVTPVETVVAKTTVKQVPVIDDWVEEDIEDLTKKGKK